MKLLLSLGLLAFLASAVIGLAVMRGDVTDQDRDAAELPADVNARDHDSGVTANAGLQIEDGADEAARPEATTDNSPIGIPADRTSSAGRDPVASQTIRDITTNLAAYPANRIPEYEKLEISFQVDTAAKNLQFPYDPNPPPGVDTSLERYNGITVNAVFKDPQGNQHQQPAFYYQEFSEDETKEWYYPTGNFMWKVRFAPNSAGMWEFKLQAQDKGNYPGWEETDWQSFDVVASAKKGFLKVSETDARYFEFDSGAYYPGLGYNENYRGIDWVKPVQNNQAKLQTMGENGIQYARIWLSQWPIFGSAWAPWRPHVGNGYHIAANLNFTDGIIYPGSELSMRILMEPDGTGGYTGNRCMLWGWESTNFPAKSGSTYRVSVRFQMTENIGPRVAGNPHGFVVKTGGWLWGDGSYCYDSGVGGLISASYDPGQVREDDPANPNGWKILEGEFMPGGDFFPRIYLALENVEDARVYVDHVWIEEIDPNTKATLGPNVVEKPDMDYHLYFEQRGSRAFDKVVDLAESSGVYLRPAIMEKNDWMWERLAPDGTFTTPKNSSNFYGSRSMTKMRWLQQAWWRYLQARWGYSTAIHSWELLNEGDPYHGGHYELTDEFGIYMHCRAFGVEPELVDINPDPAVEELLPKCDNNHPNDHPVSTSTWHSFPADRFWSDMVTKWPGIDLSSVPEAANYFNIDLSDVHRYLDPSGPSIRVEVYDPGSNTIVRNDFAFQPDDYYDAAAMVERMSQGLGALTIRGPRKPVIAGESDFQQRDPDLLGDTLGVWAHNYAWAQINSGGLYNAGLWWVNPHLYSGAYDHRPRFKTYYDFIKDVPLSNGNYQEAEAQVSNAEIRAWGQKDLFNDRAHLWIQNRNHTWKNVVDGSPIPSQSGTLSIQMSAANTDFNVEWRDTYSGVVANRQSLTSDANGILTLSFADLDGDVAVKINRWLYAVYLSTVSSCVGGTAGGCR